MHKHHNFRTGIILSVMFLIIIVCFILFEQFFITEKPKNKKNIEIALITNSHTKNVNDDSRPAINAIKKYCKEEKHTYSTYVSTSDNVEDCLTAIDKASKDNAKLIICVGSELGEAVYQAQGRYPDISFFLIDGEPASNDGSVTQTDTNVMPITFDDDESGFISGYMCVKSGYNKMAVMCDKNNSSDMHHMYGFIQGADYAATESNVKASVICKDISSANEDVLSEYASKLFSKNVQLIFTNNNSTTKLIIPIAEKYTKSIMNFGNDSTNDSESICASLTNNTENAVTSCLKLYYSGKFKGGDTTKINSTNAAFDFTFNEKSKLPMNSEDLEYIQKKLSGQAITIITDTTVDIEDLELKATNVKIK